MAIIMSENDKLRIKNGEATYNDIIKEQGQTPKTPPPPPPKSEIEKVKEELREANRLYRESIEKNRELRDEVAKSVETKRKYRDLIDELRIKKKNLLSK